MSNDNDFELSPSRAREDRRRAAEYGNGWAVLGLIVLLGIGFIAVMVFGPR